MSVVFNTTDASDTKVPINTLFTLLRSPEEIRVCAVSVGLTDNVPPFCGALPPAESKNNVTPLLIPFCPAAPVAPVAPVAP